jgi:phosphatidylglycerophosphatase A
LKRLTTISGGKTREAGLLDKLALALGTGLYSGFVPGRIATVGAALGLPLAYGLHALLDWPLYFLVTLALNLAGVWICGRAERILGRDDPREVVYDEIATMPLVFFLAPELSWRVLAAGFVLHRVFDVSKILGVDQLQRLPAGWGVMADDVLASLYAWIVLQALLRAGLT